MSRRAYSVREVADAIGASRVQVQRWIAKGEIPAEKVGSLWRVPAWWLDDKFGRYDDDNARQKRREPVPSEPGRSLGSDGADAERSSSVPVGRVQEAGSRRAPGAHQAAGRSDARRPVAAPAWSLPGEVAR